MIQQHPHSQSTVNTQTLNTPKVGLGLGTAALLALALMPAAASAYDSGDRIARIGLHHIAPKSDNHDTVEVDSLLGLTGSLVQFLTPQLALDLLLAWPFEPEVSLNGGGKVAEAQLLPPVLSLVWYPALGSTWHPYVGIGLNYSLFFDESTQGALAGSDLKLDDSFGVAAMAGVDWNLGKAWGVALDVRYIDIDSDATLDGADIGTVEVDPLCVGLSLSYRFR